MKQIVLSSIIFLLVAGCVSSKTSGVKKLSAENDICIVRNESVREAFHDAYERSILSVGYAARTVNDKNKADCSIYTTYMATYKFHWGLYLSTAELKVYENEKMVGSSEYRAPFASPQKHGRIEPKIRALVEKLFPEKN